MTIFAPNIKPGRLAVLFTQKFCYLAIESPKRFAVTITCQFPNKEEELQKKIAAAKFANTKFYTPEEEEENEIAFKKIRNSVKVDLADIEHPWTLRRNIHQLKNYNEK